MKRVLIVRIGLIGLGLQLLLMTAELSGYNYRHGWITEKPNRYPIFLKTDTEYRTDFYKYRPKKPTPTQNTDTDPPLVHCIVVRCGV